MKFFSLLALVFCMSMRCATPSAPYLNDDGTYSQYSTEPSAPEQSAYIRIITDIYSYKEQFEYECDRDAERFHDDMETIVQRMPYIVLSAFAHDIKPVLREYLLETLYQNMQGAHYTLTITINDKECSILKSCPSSGLSCYLLKYSHNTHSVIAMPGMRIKKGIYARLCDTLRSFYNKVY